MQNDSKVRVNLQEPVFVVNLVVLTTQRNWLNEDSVQGHTVTASTVNKSGMKCIPSFAVCL
jgi:hypothetical protein